MKAAKAYAWAVLLMAAALVLTFRTPIHEQSPFLLLVLAVMISAAMGFWPGVFATVLGVVSALYFTIPPSGSFVPAHPRDVAALFLFGAVGLAVTWITDSLRRSGEQVRAAAAVIDSSADAVIRTSPAGIILSWNRAAGRVLGYTVTASSRNGPRCASRTHPSRVRRRAAGRAMSSGPGSHAGSSTGAAH
jgi:PAS domain-containing protein